MRITGIFLIVATQLTFWLLAAPQPLRADDSARLIDTSHWSNHYIRNLQERGALEKLHPTNTPWTYGEVRRALNATDSDDLDRIARRWYDQLKDYFQGDEIESDVRIGGELAGRATRINSDRVDPLRPIGEGEPLLPGAHVRTYMESGHVAAQAGVTVDLEYLHDPDAVDVTHRLLGRPEHFYVGYDGDWVGFYAGRFSQHWGQPGSPAGAVTDNPRPYDRLSFRIGGKRLALRSFVGELDNLGPRGSFFDRESFEEDVIRRYISMHRLDWRPSPNFALTVYEGVVYAGDNTSFSLQYVNPLQFMAIAQDSDPKNEYANLMMGGMVWWRFGPGVFWADFMLNDIVVDNRAELAARNDLKPTATTWSAGLTLNGLHPEFDLDLRGQMVSTTAYRPQLFRGQWTYAQRGLATNFGDYIQTGIEVGWYADRLTPGLEIRPGIEVLLQGEGDIRMPLAINEPNIDQLPLVLGGTVEQTVRPYLSMRYQSGTRFWVEADIGVNHITNRGHTEGFTETPVIGMIRASYEISGEWGFDQGW